MPVAPAGRRWGTSGLLLAAALVGLVQLWTIFQTSPAVWHDFAQDYIAIQEALAGRDPYGPQNARIGELFNMPPPKEGPAYSFHPPTTLVFFVPFATLDYRAAFVAWGIVNLLSLWAIVHLTALLIRRPAAPLASFGLALGLVAVWPVRENFVEGQLNVPVTAGIVACWYWLSTGRSMLAGVALAAAVALKPLAGLFVLYALWRREWRLLFASAVAIGALAVGGLWLAGIDGTHTYVTTAYPLHAALWPGYWDNASPQGLFTRLFGDGAGRNVWRRPPYPAPGLSTALTIATWVLVVGLLFWRIGRRRAGGDRLNLDFAGLGATMLLVTPIIWPHYFVVLVAPVAVFVDALVRRRQWSWVGVLAVSLAVLWVPRDWWPARSMGTIQLLPLLAVYAVALACLWRHPIAAEVASSRQSRPASPTPPDQSHFLQAAASVPSRVASLSVSDRAHIATPDGAHIARTP